MQSSVASRIGYLLARSGFAKLRDKLDPRRSNGGVLLGLYGIVIKNHGGTHAEGLAAASADRSRFVTTRRSVVLGCGSYLPNQVLTNADLARKVDPTDEWIVQRI